jgi:hypothetical protein
MKLRLPIPTGLRHSAQGCRDGEATLGRQVDYFPQPQRGCITVRARGFNPVGVGFLCPGSPRVARASQHGCWAGCLSPVGANELGFRFRSSGLGTRPAFGPRISAFGLQSYEIRHGPHLAPGEPAAERESFGEVVLVGRLREAIRRLNPAIPEEARATIRKFRIAQFLSRGTMNP